MKSILYPFLITTVVIVITFLTFSGLELYFAGALNQLSRHPLQYAGVSFIILASDILLPVPSSIVMYVNGYALGPVMGALISLVSLMAGTVLGYYLGQLTSFGLKAKSEERTKTILSRYGAPAIVMTRGIPILAESVSITCGYNKMPFGQYFILNLIGYTPLCLLYAFCGSIGYDKNTFVISFMCSLLISLAFWLFGRFFFLKPRRRTAPKFSPTNSKSKK